MAVLRKFIFPSAVLVPLIILLGLSAAPGQEEELLLDNPDAYLEKQRSAVTFPHDYHMGELECLACHHDYDNGENILDEYDLEEGNPDILCSACHDVDSDIDLKKAYHQQCMGCHRELRLADMDTGPELCGECHIK